MADVSELLKELCRIVSEAIAIRDLLAGLLAVTSRAALHTR
jgi:hypothetical protein